MIDNAIRKINTEMQKHPNDRYVEIIGQYIIDRAGSSAELAAKIMQEKKSLKGAMDAIMGAASRAKQGQVAVLTPDTVFGAVDKYFGFPQDVNAQMAALNGAVPAPVAAPPVVSKPVALSLDDFL